MEIKDWVYAARKFKGLNQTELGSAVGRTKANIGHWEAGKHAPSYTQIKQISNFTGFPMPEDVARGAFDLRDLPLEIRVLPSVSALITKFEPAWLNSSLNKSHDEKGASFLGHSHSAHVIHSSVLPTSTGMVVSDKKSLRAPVITWARVGVDLYLENDKWPDEAMLPMMTKTEVGRRCKYIEVIDDSLAPRVLRGDMVLVDPDNVAPKRDKIALFSLPGGEHALLRYRPTLNGFEAYDERGRVMDRDKHGLTVVATYALLLREDE